MQRRFGWFRPCDGAVRLLWQQSETYRKKIITRVVLSIAEGNRWAK